MMALVIFGIGRIATGEYFIRALKKHTGIGAPKSSDRVGSNGSASNLFELSSFLREETQLNIHKSVTAMYNSHLMPALSHSSERSTEFSTGR